MISFALLIINFFILLLGAFVGLTFDDGLGGTMSFGSVIVFIFLLNITFIVIKRLVFKWNHNDGGKIL